MPLPINPELPAEKRKEIATELKKSLMKPEVLLQVSKDLGLPKVLGLPTDEAAANEVAQRMFVEVGEADSPTGGKVPSINIGIKGKRKDAGGFRKNRDAADAGCLENPRHQAATAEVAARCG